MARLPTYFTMRHAEVSAQQEDIRDLFAQYSHKSYQLRKHRIPKPKMVAYLCADLQRPQGQLLTMRARGRLQGLLQLVPRPWLSQQLGLRVWYVKHMVLAPKSSTKAARELLSRGMALLAGKADFVFARPASSDIVCAQGMEASGFRIVGNELVGVVRCEVSRRQTAARIKPIAAHHLPVVQEIARRCHRHNHYIYDPKFTPQTVSTLYGNLIARQSALSEVEVLVAEEDAQARGFLSYSLNRRMTKYAGHPLARLDFIGVHPEAQSKGLGHALNLEALRRLREEGVQVASVRTMSSNYLALAALRKLDFCPTSSNFVMHWWGGRAGANASGVPAKAQAVEMQEG